MGSELRHTQLVPALLCSERPAPRVASFSVPLLLPASSYQESTGELQEGKSRVDGGHGVTPHKQ